MIDQPALQDTVVDGPVSSQAARLAASILSGDTSLDAASALMAEHFLSQPRVEIVTVVFTSFVPADQTGWMQLGGRAWVREWAAPGSSRTLLPAPDAGPEAALSMPWVSRIARTQVVALTDRDLLPPEATQDLEELARAGVRSLIASPVSFQGDMFGSLSLVSVEAGEWPDQLIQDFRSLRSAFVSRLVLEQSRRSLAEALEAGAEAQLAAQQLFGAVGHELRTPLSAILGYTEGLLDDAEHGTADDVATGMKRDGPVIVRSCERLLSIVDNLLGAGRAMSADDQRQEVSVADAVADVMHWHRTPARTAGVDMQAHVDPRLAAWGHPSAIRQVLANLLGNAIAHHRPTGGTVHLTAEALVGESAKPMLRIIVRDDGPGLTPEQLAHVFEPFVRFAAPTTQGSGLGLSLSRTIAEREGGAVRGESTPGTGSSFWLELPAFRPRQD
ncbi:HAMP domain-containing sensor histidine kinase [uncultured Nocardioides sp.]|uniref:sensor histidine kinase n=1 Tax=uncultured Nocardioides sp. TaxID=198441 RepID=UPI002636E1C0|nr:HAMP domain-containing sensor histidine kinase [uncultured Nocardioides sp.]